MNEFDSKAWEAYFKHSFLPSWIKVAIRTFLPWAIFGIYYFVNYPFDLMSYSFVIFWPILLIAPFFAISYFVKKKRFIKYLEEGNAS